MSESPLTEPPFPESLVRGVSLRAYIHYLRDEGTLERVRATIPEETRHRIDEPPLATEWVAQRHTGRVLEAYAAIAGAEAVRRMAYVTARDSISQILWPVIRAALGVFGASPEVILRHAQTLTRFNVRGQLLRYVPTGPCGGDFEIRFVGVHPPPAVFDGWAGILECAIELCGTVGRVVVKGTRTEGADGIGTLELTWKAP